MDSRQSVRLVHTDSAHSAVVGGRPRSGAWPAAATTIATTPITMAAMNQFLRTGRV